MTDITELGIGTQQNSANARPRNTVPVEDTVDDSWDAGDDDSYYSWNDDSDELNPYEYDVTTHRDRRLAARWEQENALVVDAERRERDNEIEDIVGQLQALWAGSALGCEVVETDRLKYEDTNCRFLVFEEVIDPSPVVAYSVLPIPTIVDSLVRKAADLLKTGWVNTREAPNVELFGDKGFVITGREELAHFVSEALIDDNSLDVYSWVDNTTSDLLECILLNKIISYVRVGKTIADYGN